MATSKSKNDLVLKLDPAPTFSVDVTLTGHGDTPGPTLGVEYKHMGKKAAAAWMEAQQGSERPAAETLCEIIASIKVGDGDPVTVTPEIFEAVMDDYPRPFQDLLREWMIALHEGRIKN